MIWPRAGLRALQRILPGRSDQLVVLAYHLVGADTDSPVDLPIQRFERQLDEIARIAQVMPLEKALERTHQASSSERIERPLVVLTFDDAYENFYREAWPRLEERSLPATLFVPVGFVEGEIGPPIAGTEGLAAATWSMLREAQDSGLLSIGSHSWSHPDLRGLPPERLRRELVGSRKHLEERTGHPVTTFCYPRALWDRRTQGRVAAAYESAVIGGGKAVTRYNLDPHRIWRTSIRRDGPTSLAPVLTARVWLEEWVADQLRRHRG